MTTTFYLIHGTDDLSIDEAVDEFRRNIPPDDMNFSEYDGAQVSAADVLAAVCSYPFLGDTRTVIVKGLLAWLKRRGAGAAGKKGIAQLIAEIPELPKTARLILVEHGKIKDDDAFYIAAEKAKNATIKTCNAPKNITNWVIERAQKKYGAVIDVPAASALAAVIGDDLRRADNELIKLTAYVGPDAPITEADVAQLTPYVQEASIFDMTTAIGDGKSAAALEMLYRILSDKNQDVFNVFSMIVRQFRLLLLTREYLNSGGSPGSVADAIGVAWRTAKDLIPQSRAFTLADLERIYHQLHELDFKMKTGQIEPEIALDVFIAGQSR